MIRLSGHGVQLPSGMPHQPSDLHERWAKQYGPVVAAQLEPRRRYTLIKIGSAEFAYSDYGHYLRALGQAWDAGFVPDPLPSTVGSELLDVAPSLRGVDVDLGDLQASDVEAPPARFS